MVEHMDVDDMLAIYVLLSKTKKEEIVHLDLELCCGALSGI